MSALTTGRFFFVGEVRFSFPFFELSIGQQLGDVARDRVLLGFQSTHLIRGATAKNHITYPVQISVRLFLKKNHLILIRVDP